MAIEDAAALGIIFSPSYFDGDIKQALEVYEKVRLPRATKVQSAAAKAAYNINERIGKSMLFSCLVVRLIVLRFLKQYQYGKVQR